MAARVCPEGCEGASKRRSAPQRGARPGQGFHRFAAREVAVAALPEPVRSERCHAEMECATVRD